MSNHGRIATDVCELPVVVPSKWAGLYKVHGVHKEKVHNKPVKKISNEIKKKV